MFFSTKLVVDSFVRQVYALTAYFFYLKVYYCMTYIEIYNLSLPY